MPRVGNRSARTVLAFAFGLLAASCGFHLRGDVEYTFKTLYLNAPADNSLTPELRRTIESGGRVQLAGTPQAAEVVVDVANVTDEKQVSPGDRLKIRLGHGKLDAEVK